MPGRRTRLLSSLKLIWFINWVARTWLCKEVCTGLVDQIPYLITNLKRSRHWRTISQCRDCPRTKDIKHPVNWTTCSQIYHHLLDLNRKISQQYTLDHTKLTKQLHTREVRPYTQTRPQTQEWYTCRTWYLRWSNRYLWVHLAPQRLSTLRLNNQCHSLAPVKSQEPRHNSMPTQLGTLCCQS